MAFSTNDVQYRFYYYANSKCECCKKELIFENRDKGSKGAWHAHHVIPRGVRYDNSIVNMSILCINEPENCHLKQAHGSDYKQTQNKAKI